MTGCKTAGLGERAAYVDLFEFRGCAFNMPKKYELIRDKIPVPGGGFIEAFRMALVELSSLGERHLDLTGYPHESEEAALMSDWAALGVDFREAANKVATEVAEEGSRESVSGPAGRDKVTSG